VGTGGRPSGSFCAGGSGGSTHACHVEAIATGIARLRQMRSFVCAERDEIRARCYVIVVAQAERVFATARRRHRWISIDQHHVGVIRWITPTVCAGDQVIPGSAKGVRNADRASQVVAAGKGIRCCLVMRIWSCSGLRGLLSILYYSTHYVYMDLHRKLADLRHMSLLPPVLFVRCFLLRAFCHSWAILRNIPLLSKFSQRWN
jgi:hypothetical protein